MKFASYFLVIPILFIIAFFGLTDSPNAPSVTLGAENEKNLVGWAWSSNIGWISFSCENRGTCGTFPYQVKINSFTGDFSGYAWNGSTSGSMGSHSNRKNE